MNVQNIIIIILIVLLVYILYLYFYRSSSNTLVDMKDASSEFEITPTKYGGGTSDNYTYSMWININDYGDHYGTPKVIMYRKADNSSSDSFSPLVYLDGTANNLIISTSAKATKSDISAQHAKCIIKDVPIQTWFCVIITLNGNVMDVYYNGKLVKSCLLFEDSNDRASPYKDNSPIYFSKSVKLSDGTQAVGGFTGQIANVNFYPNSINPNDAYSIYKTTSGKINRSINLDYKIRGTLFKNGKEWGETDFSF